MGSRVLVAGEFGGFGYEMQSRRITLHSDSLCNERGAGLVFAELVSRQEAEKLGNARPKPKRGEGRGDSVSVEGVIEKIEEGRFVRLSNACVADAAR